MSIEYSAVSRLDAQSLQSMADVFKSLADARDDVTIDMSHVEFIDGSGVGALVYLMKRARANQRSMKVINLNGQPKQLLDKLRLTRVLQS